MKRCGVYCIRHEPSGGRYIGSSIDIDLRFKNHFGELRRGSHWIRAMQIAHINDGRDAFTTSVIVECSSKDLAAAEKKAIDEMSPEFNRTARVHRSPNLAVSKVVLGMPPPTKDRMDALSRRIGVSAFLLYRRAIEDFLKRHKA